MLRDGEELGGFWLDMHPRPDKFKHAAMFPIQTGLDGARAQRPWAALVCNFPTPTASDPALMQHDVVVTLFHEFGHLIHHLMARGPTIKLSADNEGDFIEAPSQLLEEWAWRPEILRRFAKHIETGEAIPDELVAKMKKADGFGRGMDLMRQIYYSAFSWFIHVEDPEALDFEAFTTAMYRRYSPNPRPEVDQLYASFGHLTDYSSNYYTYQWSLAIAKDLYTRFAPNPMDPTVAAEYRQKVLEAGATKDAGALVSDFLGRPMNLDAYRAWITQE
jgi:thimet oligopeptidase